MVSGKILRSDKATLDSTGLFLSHWRTAKERGYGLKDKGRYEKQGYVFGVNGAVAFYRKEMLEKIKINNEYFDKGLRMFYGDLDIAWRAQNSGWKGYYIPGAVACHVRGATARGGRGINKRFARRFLSDELYADLIKNRYRVILKNDTFLSFLLNLPFILIYDAISWAYTLLFRPAVLIKFFLKSR
jgi:Predicted glycosyltransferases